MNDSLPIYLRPEAVAQPLFMQWYCWAYLIPPATAALNVANRHIAIMRSYIRAPFVHAAACKDPKMLGGPFMNFGFPRVDEVKSLLERTLTKQNDLVILAEALADLRKLLKAECHGFGMESLYQKIPAPLDGFVEMTYDLQNRPGFRMLEGLLYQSPYYNTDYQSFAFSRAEIDDRPFVLSTPFLEDEKELHLAIPFADKRLDDLFQTERTPRSYGSIREMFLVPDDREPLFRRLFTEEPPAVAPSRTQDGFSGIRYFGHACLLFRSGDCSILVDPAVSYGQSNTGDRFNFGDLPERLDAILLTHNHQDHVIFETLLRLRHKTDRVVIPQGGGNLQDPSLKRVLACLGFRDVVELDELEELQIGPVKITACPFLGEHADLDIRTKSTYVIEMAGRRHMLAVDADNLSPKMYRHLHRCLGDLDGLFLGMECDGAPASWLYGPLFEKQLSKEHDRSRRLQACDHSKALDLIHCFNFPRVFIYAMGMEPWMKHIMAYPYGPDSKPIIESNRLLELCRERGIQAERLYGKAEISFS